MSLIKKKKEKKENNSFLFKLANAPKKAFKVILNEMLL